ncbi:rRNA maturation RNase YbeY [Nevskia soli]|uniref:rRNA maturation RNase YbeY n=1 Tax=Nevskia soli TaxID=418856 RepID=UPI00055EC865|nr:rRNA maturation RNase YbeY [Nevskia soli]
MSANPMINVQRRVTAAGIPAPSSLRAWAMAALEGATPGEITIRVVAEEESAALNGKFRHKPYPTNVLSFPYEAEAPSEQVLGDLVICAPVVAREAVEQNKEPNAHWAHMVVHGVLHLLGHDHIQEEEAERMEAKERQILARLGFPDPY